jgi:hypothetical protein
VQRHPARAFRKGLGSHACAERISAPRGPEIVRVWVENPPGWFEVRVAPASDDPSLQSLDDGERAAIALAVMFKADLILMDDRAGVAVARSKGFAVSGTLGLLDLAARPQVTQAGRSLGTTQSNEFPLPAGNHGRASHASSQRTQGVIQ